MVYKVYHHLIICIYFSFSVYSSQLNVLTIMTVMIEGLCIVVMLGGFFCYRATTFVEHIKYWYNF